MSVGQVQVLTSERPRGPDNENFENEGFCSWFGHNIRTISPPTVGLAAMVITGIALLIISCVCPISCPVTLPLLHKILIVIGGHVGIGLIAAAIFTKVCAWATRDVEARPGGDVGACQGNDETAGFLLSEGWLAENFGDDLGIQDFHFHQIADKLIGEQAEDSAMAACVWAAGGEAEEALLEAEQALKDAEAALVDAGPALVDTEVALNQQETDSYFDEACQLEVLVDKGNVLAG